MFLYIRKAAIICVLIAANIPPNAVFHGNTNEKCFAAFIPKGIWKASDILRWEIEWYKDESVQYASRRWEERSLFSHVKSLSPRSRKVRGSGSK